MPRMIAISGDTYPVRSQLKQLGARWNPWHKVWLVPPEKAETARYIVAYRQMPPAQAKPPAAPAPAPAVDHWTGFQLPGTAPATSPAAQDAPEPTPQPEPLTAEQQGFKVSGFYNTSRPAVPPNAIPLSSLIPQRTARPAAPPRITRPAGKTVDDLLAAAFPD